jgi:processive 1,2-diacylglycerol beta-glucosyltransferase
MQKILILSASAGAGHVRAADALQKAFQERNANLQVRNLDALLFTRKIFRTLYSKGYLEMVQKQPHLLGWFYDQTDRPWKNEKIRLALDRVHTQPLVKEIRSFDPDLILCTHFLPAEIVSWMRAKKKIRAKHGIVVTDFDAHALWFCHHYDWYFVALEETALFLERVGIRREAIHVTGIPIDPVFSKPLDKREIRARHKLDPDLTTLLISAGGYGVGPMEKIITSLSNLDSQLQVLAICGKSEELKAKLESLKKQLQKRASKLRLHPVGFTSEMDEWMAAADLMIGKPGGLTTSEALARGLPMLIVNPIPGQEERNADHLLEWGCAVRCNNIVTLDYKLRSLLVAPEKLSRLSANCVQRAHPFAAEQIIEIAIA